jgi:hypothetical protein
MALILNKASSVKGVELKTTIKPYIRLEIKEATDGRNFNVELRQYKDKDSFKNGDSYIYIDQLPGSISGMNYPDSLPASPSGTTYKDKYLTMIHDLVVAKLVEQDSALNGKLSISDID